MRFSNGHFFKNRYTDPWRRTARRADSYRSEQPTTIQLLWILRFLVLVSVATVPPRFSDAAGSEVHAPSEATGAFEVERPDTMPESDDNVGDPSAGLRGSERRSDARGSSLGRGVPITRFESVTIGATAALALLGAVVWMTRRCRPASRTSEPLVKGRVQLTGRHAVYLLEAGGRSWLVGVGPQGPPSVIGTFPHEANGAADPSTGEEVAS